MSGSGSIILASIRSVFHGLNGVNVMPERTCAYCGKVVGKVDKEHVIPRCLYPSSKSKSKVQRLTVPACRECNASWADDEAHFRNIMVIAGESNAAVRELWNTKTERSFQQVDGKRRLADLVAQMKPHGERQMVYPGQDPKVMRVIRKIIRGLCHHHGIMSPVSDEQVWADVLTYVVPSRLLKSMERKHREADIFEYCYDVPGEPDIHSAWLLTFFEQRTFIGIVCTSPDGLSELAARPAAPN